MKKNYWWIIFASLVITLFGLLTKKYFFLLLFFPLSYLFKKDEFLRVKKKFRFLSLGFFS